MGAFGLVASPWPETRLALIARRYCGSECKLQFHRDSFTLFEEPVFGLVLRRGVAAPRLALRPAAPSRHAAAFALQERPGLAIWLEGPARYEWSHGVFHDSSQRAGTANKRGQDEATPESERLSLTWRWVRASALAWASASGPQAELWVARFMALAQERGLSRAQALAFLGARRLKDDRPLELTAGKVREVVLVPWLRAVHTEAALLAADPAKGPEHCAETALSLLRLWEEAGVESVR
mmetsp:Transcript_21728/g.65305  ORF Transcript_21728/g.65305 Transcript_21728/m.65305 type:complete len:238 (+) Transcript_21728:1-714(+)